VFLEPRVPHDVRADYLAGAGLVALVVLLFSGVVRWHGYGPELMWAHLLVRIGTARTPSDRGRQPHTAHAVDVRRPSAREQSLSRRLRHKAICSTPAVVAKIRDFISSGV